MYVIINYYYIGYALNNIDPIVKQIITNTRSSNTPLTPDNYFEQFNEYSKKLEIETEDILLFNKFLNSITENEKKYIKNETPLNLLKVLINRIDEEKIKLLLSVFDDILAPSVDFSLKDEIENLINELLNSPKALFEQEKIRDLQNISKKRVTLDNDILRQKTDDIIKITNLMEKYFEKTLKDSNNSSNEINNIKEDINSLNISSSSQRELSLLQSKLVDIIYRIENNINDSVSNLTENKEQFNKLNETIVTLQNELSIAKKEKDTDFLTDILNRRAYKEAVQKIEKKYKFFNANYAIVFLDIDHFKIINDTYGHVCGDAILKSFAKVLKQLTRQEDVLARYGGEEFISLINYQNKEEVTKYIIRLKKIIDSNSFVFKNAKIGLKFSAGVTFRENHESYEQAKIEADELLYKAKHNGRDQVLFEGGGKI